MKYTKKKDNFIDRTARKPAGEWAVKYYSNPKAHYRSFHILLESLTLERDDIYCEIGCGGGVLLKMAMAHAGRGAAIDHSDEMVALAIKNNRQSVDDGILDVIQGNAEALPWPSGSFTACASANMFFFVENPVAVLSEVARILKPEGRFTMVTLGSGLITKATFGLLYSLKTYSDRKMLSMMEVAGFRNIRVKTNFLGTFQVCYGEK